MSRFIDERGRIFGKVNVVDLLVLLVIVAVIVLASVRFVDAKVDTVPVRVTYMVERVRQATVEALRATLDPAVGKNAVTDEGSTLLGQIQEISVTPTREQVTTDTGELKIVASELFSDVSIVVLGEGLVSGSSVRIGSVPIKVGKRATLVGAGFEVSVTVMAVTWGPQAADSAPIR